MILVDDNPNFRAELQAEVAYVIAYLSDLEGLQLGSYPGWKDWSSGKRIIGSTQEFRAITALRGRLADGKEIVTGPIQLFALNQRWARATSGLYRLIQEGDG